MNKSVWDEYKNSQEYTSLNKDIETDVLVIGGGIAGILTARKLHDNNYKTVLIEKNKIASGNTSKTTAFLTIQHETLYQDLNEENRKEYLELNKKALNEYKELSKMHDFDYEECDSCLFSIDDDLIKNEYNVLEELKEEVYISNNIPYHDNINGICFKNQAVINPIKLINCLADGLEIYENSKVDILNKNYAVLDNGAMVKFKYVVVATGYPINNVGNLLFMKLTQRKSYVVAIKKECINNTYCSLDIDGIYFRKYKDYLIIGGNDTDTGCKCISSFKDKICKLLNIENDLIEYSWYGQDCITLDGIPYVGVSDIFHENHIIITGFNLWGFTWAMASSNIVLDIIRNNKECKLTKLNRKFLNKNLFKNIGNSVSNFLKLKKPRCRHLGCALLFNKETKEWECSCHGSTYDINGNVINGPSKHNIK